MGWHSILEHPTPARTCSSHPSAAQTHLRGAKDKAARNCSLGGPVLVAAKVRDRPLEAVALDLEVRVDHVRGPRLGNLDREVVLVYHLRNHAGHRRGQLVLPQQDALASSQRKKLEIAARIFVLPADIVEVPELLLRRRPQA